MSADPCTCTRFRIPPARDAGWTGAQRSWHGGAAHSPRGLVPVPPELPHGLGVDLVGAVAHHSEEDPAGIVERTLPSLVRKGHQPSGDADHADDGILLLSSQLRVPSL